MLILTISIGKIFLSQTKKTKAYWDNELTTGSDKKKWLLDLFFYSYMYQIKYQEPELMVTTEDKLLFSKVESLFESYKSLIKNYMVCPKPKYLKKFRNMLRYLKDL